MNKLKLNLGCSKNLLEGFENLDIFSKKQDASIKLWEWNTALPYPDNSASLILVQHVLMYCAKQNWDSDIEDIYRVLSPGGVFILKEDNNLKYCWHSVGTKGVMSSTNLKEIIPTLERNKFKILSTDPKKIIEKYGSIINRQKKLLAGKMFVLEARK